MSKLRKICVIPARSGSKRVMDKNILEISGKPMIAWTIEAALESKIFDRVIVSTDSEVYADISLEAGAEVPFLRDKYNDSHTVVSEATKYCVEQCELHYKEQFDTVFQLMANCPIRKVSTILNFDEYFYSHNCSSLITAFKYGFMNPWWALKLNDEGYGERIFDSIINQRSQDLPDLYCPTGSIWACAKVDLFENSSFYGKKTQYFPISWKEAIDIDDEDDLELASYYVK